MRHLLTTLCRRSLLTAAVFFEMLIATAAFGRSPLPTSKEEALRAYQHTMALARPIVTYAAHRRGNIELAVANNGTFGTYGSAVTEPYTGQIIQSCIYPKNSDLVFLWVGAFWIGAVVGRDTLVSTGTEDFYENQEFWPEVQPFGDFTFSSIDLNSKYYSPNAYSEQDVYAEYTDTVTTSSLVANDQVDQRPHKPLGIKVYQRSMAWSYAYADDFLLFDYKIENIGRSRLKDVYMGVWVDGDVWHTTRNGPSGWNDDVVGFLHTYPAPEGCGFVDTVNIAYHADNDGDPVGPAWDYRSTRGVVGTKVVRTPADTPKYSFNWWIINYSDPARDFGPRRRETPGDPFRDMGSRLGTPLGDRNKYYLLRHQEFDYDLYETALDHSLEGWLPPPPEGIDYAKGWDTRYLLSFGPFTIEPGQKLPISFAWVGGTNFHAHPSDFEDLFDPMNPHVFYSSLNFADLATNARWASWVYDNPGVDTDGDGYFGKARICQFDSLLIRIDTIVSGPDTTLDSIYQVVPGDSLWYEGDGKPDFRGAGPPPAPRMRIMPSDSRLVVRWNGYYSETTPDIFTRYVDFEGYRVYLALDDRLSSFSMVRSFDREDYRRFSWRTLPTGELGWALDEVPFTLDSLRLMTGDSAFMPLQYTQSRPFVSNDTLYFFEPQDYNSSDLTDTVAGIHKIYPDATRPDADPASWLPEELTWEHGEPLPKYYEYEIALNDLLPSVPYYVSVTALDFGSPQAGLEALETSPTNNMIVEYPQTSADTVEALSLEAYVYPNPYRIDGGYEAGGYENRDHTMAVERARLLHFANLPRVCTISIFSLDGDLIRKLDHNYPQGGPGAMHETWDLVTRNTQSVVSGIYYFVIESQDRSQVGKFVIIK
ncbi:MAG: T9SS type A sorting domain-containing protein [Candidatus Zixiibacteriota bacterium]